MNLDEMKKEWSIKGNWRAHISNYIELKKRKKKESFSTEDYCKQQGIDHEAFNAWLKHIEREDRFTFYTSFASEHINRAKRSLDLVEKYIDTSELRMPLMRDVIIAYAAPFKNSYGRLSNKFSLNNIVNIVPEAFQITHTKICEDRDTIVAHCDLGPRNPRVGIIGISIRMAGYYWEDYQILIPDLKKLILAVQENLKGYNQEKFIPADVYFQESINSPKSADKDPGPPSVNNYIEKTN